MLNKKIVLIVWCFFAGAKLSYAADRLAGLSVDSCAQVSIAKQDFTTYKSLSEDLQKNIKMQNDLISQLSELVAALELKNTACEDRLRKFEIKEYLLQEEIKDTHLTIQRFGVATKVIDDKIIFSRMSRSARSHVNKSTLREAAVLRLAKDSELK